MDRITFKVSGMSCMGCVNSVKGLLSTVAGVNKVEIDLGSGQVQVEYDSGRTNPDALRQAIEDGGYGVSV